MSATVEGTTQPATPEVLQHTPRRIDELLRDVLVKGGSDLHFVAGDPPRIRLHGELQALRDARLDKDTVREMLTEVMTRRAQAQLEQKDGADFAYTIPGVSRFRVNVFRHIGGLGGVFRAIPSKALTLEQLNLPESVRSLCRVNNGLILVTGKTGSGKSTTLAAMIDDINQREKGHILTIEDPIEFVHPRKNCLVSQREVGLHSPGFAEALHSALREDPDIILVGELRDLETMGIAVTAAEMGILVMGTLHTNGAAATVDRIVNAFPSDKQSHVRTMLSTSLRGVISQQLIQRADKRGRVAALEILINTPAVSNLIRQGKLDQLENAMQSGATHGMRVMDSAIQELFDKGVINGRAAYEKAINKQRFEQFKDMG
ncbi:MAG TPA: type IV pilus twitching motility protein PilT [Steroidobacteraceae bacterium]|nr:type IV pilus twitching motility protein PilT [Steroidobacteraceae bacterium]